MRTKENEKRKKWIRKIYILTAFIIAFVSSTVWWYWNSSEERAADIFAHREYLIVGVISCVVYWFFARMYQAHKIGVYRITELIYFQLLSFGMTDVTLLLASVLWFRGISGKQVLTCFLVLTGQIILSSICVVVFHRMWSAYDAPLKTAVIYGQDGYAGILEKMRDLYYRYNVTGCYSDRIPVTRLVKIADDNDRLYLYKVNGKVRRELLLHCNNTGKDIYISQEIEDLLTIGFDVSHAFDTPFIRTKRMPVKWYYPIVKRGMDILCSGAAFIILSPLLLVIALSIKLYDGGPVLYSQIRLTKGHRTFRIYKFRSMIPNAEKEGARLASQHDSRVTPVGKIIRATRLDELPQLINILKGDMSIVGPRPERPEIEAEYLKELPEFGMRLQVQAGLTGYAQVFGKYNTTPEDKLKLDLLYINQRSLMLDLKLILYTVKIMFIPESTEGVSEGQRTAVSTNNSGKSSV